MSDIQDDIYLSNRQLFRDFAQSRRRSTRELDEDYESLLADPHLVGLTFMASNPKILMLQTPIIEILHEGCYYRIGAFVIMISRRFEGRSWRVDFRLKNLNHLVERKHFCGLVHHPHIYNVGQDETFGTNVGYFCTEARGLIETPLKQGRIFDAYPMFLEILTVYPTGTAYHDVEHWPLAPNQEETGNDL